MKGSVLGKMPGDMWQKFAGVRGLLRLHSGPPGQEAELHGRGAGHGEGVGLRQESGLGAAGAGAQPPAPPVYQGHQPLLPGAVPLWEIDFDWEGFQWLVSDDNHNNVVVFLRRDKTGNELVCAINFSPNTYEDYRFGCPPVRGICGGLQLRPAGVRRQRRGERRPLQGLLEGVPRHGVLRGHPHPALRRRVPQGPGQDAGQAQAPEEGQGGRRAEKPEKKAVKVKSAGAGKAKGADEPPRPR